jgi:PiT family inorganic phosphate transporter
MPHADLMFCTVVFTVAVALLFDVINGFHDAANSIATVVSTRVLSPRIAVLWAAAFNFAAMSLFAPRVANTIAQLVDVTPGEPAFVLVVLAGLLGAVIWDLLTWVWALPTSSSHALVGGIVGAGLAYGGTGALHWPKIIATVQFIPLAPLLGFCFGFVLMLSLFWLLRNWRPATVDSLFRRCQLVSAAAYALGHGGNDAQKTMGIIVAVLVASGHLGPRGEDAALPSWIVVSCNAAMALGTAFGGWRIVKTMGMRITKLQPVGGFCAEVAGALTLCGSTLWGIPVSTTHTITGAIMGVGSTRGFSGIRWGIAGRIVWAWLLTIPASAAVAALCFYALQRFVVLSPS